MIRFHCYLIFFVSVYVEKSNDELPVLQDKDILQEMELPYIDCNLVEKHLKDLKVSKTPGPDGIHPSTKRTFLSPRHTINKDISVIS